MDLCDLVLGGLPTRYILLISGLVVLCSSIVASTGLDDIVACGIAYVTAILVMGRSRWHYNECPDKVETTTSSRPQRRGSKFLMPYRLTIFFDPVLHGSRNQRPLRLVGRLQPSEGWLEMGLYLSILSYKQARPSSTSNSKSAMLTCSYRLVRTDIDS